MVISKEILPTSLMDVSKLQMREGKSTRKREASECGAAFSVTESCQMWAKTPRRARKEGGRDSREQRGPSSHSSHHPSSSSPFAYPWREIPFLHHKDMNHANRKVDERLRE